ncbi:probable arginine--tRNA ligase, mitochondrial [Episyrphus balteatus]|uniref:probable arginine--tRNA ligase, mitochondrial n=1 Tax=Episyrphus balteatus TaxID=286459 RepID=UPI0024864F27|nr:probable arginine--tRNA ligase, mitochondrial [Episyrphus balteatus]
MSSRIRKTIGQKISQIIKRTDLEDAIAARLELPRSLKSAAHPELHLSSADLTSITGTHPNELLGHLSTSPIEKEIVESVASVASRDHAKSGIAFKLNQLLFASDVLRLNFASPPATHSKGCVVLDFSSPNIAKPFHVGHLRSTIIGNVLGNLYKHLGHGVVKMNYLGDWGTQLGMLQVGVELEQLTDEQMRVNPIENLYRAYVRSNTEAKSDPSITEKARKYFTDLENETAPEMQMQWQKYRAYTVSELEGVYQRLGVEFDVYDWESQYSQKAVGSIVEMMKDKNLIHDEKDGRKIVNVGERRVPVIKSDGSTLYLVRDIAALLDRFERFKFEKMFYVVDNAQTDHFDALFKVTSGINADIGRKAKHIKFGRIRGMSTRTGKAVFLKDLLNEARDIMMEKQLQSPTTKINVSSLDSTVADVLGVSAVIINDLKQRRQRDYDFDWNNALQTNGDTGIKLQYTHCRLSSLLENMSHVQVAEHPNGNLLQEPVALELIVQIARFDQSILKAAETLEACVLVTYLFSLCNCTSRALKLLKVKGEPSAEIQANRLLLFTAAREVLGCGMKILGLKPLTKM